MQKLLKLVAPAMLGAMVAYSGAALAGNFGMSTEGGTMYNQQPGSSGPAPQPSTPSHGSTLDNAGPSQSQAPSASQNWNQRSSAEQPSHVSRQQSGSETVKKAQEALNQQGAQLQVDGKIGPKTRSALKQYQESHGLAATGRLDQQTRDKLNV